MFKSIIIQIKRALSDLLDVELYGDPERPNQNKNCFVDSVPNPLQGTLLLITSERRFGIRARVGKITL